MEEVRYQYDINEPGAPQARAWRQAQSQKAEGRRQKDELTAVTRGSQVDQVE